MGASSVGNRQLTGFRLAFGSLCRARTSPANASLAHARDFRGEFSTRHNGVREHWARVPESGGEPGTPEAVYRCRVKPRRRVRRASAASHDRASAPRTRIAGRAWRRIPRVAAVTGRLRFVAPHEAWMACPDSAPGSSNSAQPGIFPPLGRPRPAAGGAEIRHDQIPRNPEPYMQHDGATSRSTLGAACDVGSMRKTTATLGWPRHPRYSSFTGRYSPFVSIYRGSAFLTYLSSHTVVSHNTCMTDSRAR